MQKPFAKPEIQRLYAELLKQAEAKRLNKPAKKLTEL